MNTKYLIKKMSKSQDVRPDQLIKHPKLPEIELVMQDDLESVDELIERKAEEIMKKPSKEEQMKRQLEDICHSLAVVTKRCEEIQQALEILLADHTVIFERLTTVEERLYLLENKPSFWKRILKWR